MKELLKDKTLRMHIFGMFQWFIGIFGLGYLTSQCDNAFEVCLSVFTFISLLCGMQNIKKAEKRIAASCTAVYMIAKTMKHEEMINSCMEYDEIQFLASLEEEAEEEEAKKIMKENK